MSPHSRQMLLVATLLTAIATAQARTVGESPSSCPQGCECLDDLEVNCQNKQLISVPDFKTDNSFMSLDLSRNNIIDVSAEAFVTFPSLKYLTLSHNQIRHLDVLAFREADYMEKIHLDYNNITSLHHRIFHFNPRIKTLTLRGNPLDVTTKLPFSDSLHTLDLSHCQLKTFTNEFLTGFKLVHTLTLSHNSLMSLPIGFFDNLPKLKRLYLHGNPWRCDGEMEKLLLSKLDIIADYKDIHCITSDGEQRGWSQSGWETIRRIASIEPRIQEALGTSPNDVAKVVTSSTDPSRDSKDDERALKGATELGSKNITYVILIILFAIFIVVMLGVFFCLSGYLSGMNCDSIKNKCIRQIRRVSIF